MRILLDSNISYISQLFELLGTCEQFSSSRQPSIEQLKSADALIIRSTTIVHQELLQQAERLKFLGTATIGVDHLDINALDKYNIEWSNASGCNAQAVLEYVIFSMLAWFRGQERGFSGCKVAVVGYGSIGFKLVHALSKLGAHILVVDPFKHNDLSHPLPANARWASIDETVDADIVSLHTPLTTTDNSQHPTFHLIDADYLSQFTGELIINTCRGAVIDNAALNICLDEQPKRFNVILDVWEFEPTPLNALVSKAWQATSHIAGYSLEGKVFGSYMIYQALCRFMETKPRVDVGDLLPNITIESKRITNKHELYELFYTIKRDDADMRTLIDLPESEQGAYFDSLRKNYNLRREVSAYASGLSPFLSQLSDSDLSSVKRVLSALGTDLGVDSGSSLETESFQ